jgi:hypothetical protein
MRTQCVFQCLSPFCSQPRLVRTLEQQQQVAQGLAGIFGGWWKSTGVLVTCRHTRPLVVEAWRHMMSCLQATSVGLQQCLKHVSCVQVELAVMTDVTN